MVKGPADRNRSYTGYYAVLKGLLVRGGYQTADLKPDVGHDFTLELGFLRQIRDATIEPDDYPRSQRQRRLDQRTELAVWENEGGSPIRLRE